jgi:hypothetical protein
MLVWAARVVASAARVWAAATASRVCRRSAGWTEPGRISQRVRSCAAGKAAAAASVCRTACAATRRPARRRCATGRGRGRSSRRVRSYAAGKVPAPGSARPAPGVVPPMVCLRRAAWQAPGPISRDASSCARARALALASAPTGTAAATQPPASHSSAPEASGEMRQGARSSALAASARASARRPARAATR